MTEPRRRLPVPSALDRAARELFGPLIMARPGASGFRVVSWDSEQGLSLTLGRGRRMILIELEERDELRDCYARTKRFNVCARPEFEAGAELDAEERRAVGGVIAILQARESRLPVFEPPRQKSQIREVTIDRMLIQEGDRRYYLNAYAGCTIGCGFCYVADRAGLSRKLAGLPEVAWGSYVDVKINAAEVLKREVKMYPPGLVRMSPILTDPYQPVERRYGITRSVLEVLLNAGFTPALLTRAARITRDLDLLRRFPKAAVGLSIPTDDDRIRRLFEPRADPVEARIEALRKCHEAGLLTCAVIQPTLPMSPERLVDAIAPLVKAVRIDRMHFLDRVQHIYDENGLSEAATDEFFERTSTALIAGFRERGVLVDDKDDLTGLLMS